MSSKRLGPAGGLFLVLVLLLGGCARRPFARSTQLASTAKPFPFVLGAQPAAHSAAPLPLAESPSSWRLDLRHRWDALGVRDLGAAGTLWVGSRGERWLAPADQSRPRNAPSLLPEDLVGALPRSDGSWVFVGSSGTSYAAPSLFAPAAVLHAPREPMRSVSVGRDSLLFLSASGAVLRSTDAGASFVTPSALRGRACSDLAMRDTGDGLLLTERHQVLLTEDDGASWRPLPATGIEGVTQRDDGHLALLGAQQSFYEFQLRPFRMGGAAHYVSRQSSARSSRALRGLPAFPDVSGGARQLIGAGLVELFDVGIEPEREQFESWSTNRTQLADPPSLHRQARFDACNLSVHVAWGERLVVGCLPRNEAAFTFFASTDRGEAWHDERATAWHVIEQAWLDRLRVRGLAYDATHDDVLSVDVGERRAQDQGFTLYLYRWHVGALRPERLPQPVGSADVYPPGIWFGIDGPGAGEHDPPRPSIAFDDAGYLRVAVPDSRSDANGAHSWALFGSADRGVTLHYLKDLPYSRLALSGRRGFALDARGEAFETADGGLSWVPVRAPALEPRWFECSDFGCEFSSAVRIGWDLPDAGAQKHGLAGGT